MRSGVCFYFFFFVISSREECTKKEKSESNISLKSSRTTATQHLNSVRAIEAHSIYLCGRIAKAHYGITLGNVRDEGG
jgi:hypothetical protein